MSYHLRGQEMLFNLYETERKGSHCESVVEGGHQLPSEENPFGLAACDFLTIAFRDEI